MQKIISFMLLLFLWISPLVLAADIQAEGTSMRKLQRGFLNIALCPIEIAQEAVVESKKQTLEPTWLLGMLRGSVYAVGRAIAGVYEILTFPIAMPANYQPIIQPEFAYQHLESPDPVK